MTHIFQILISREHFAPLLPLWSCLKGYALAYGIYYVFCQYCDGSGVKPRVNIKFSLCKQEFQLLCVCAHDLICARLSSSSVNSTLSFSSIPTMHSQCDRLLIYKHFTSYRSSVFIIRSALSLYSLVLVKEKTKKVNTRKFLFFIPSIALFYSNRYSSFCLVSNRGVPHSQCSSVNFRY